MIKKLIFIFFFLFTASESWSQQFGLFNSGTLYDAFENPSQKAFQADSSRKFAFNFFIPTISFDAAFRGPAEENFKTLIYNKVINGRNINAEPGDANLITATSNNYMLMIRIFKSVEYNQEIGFSWQIRNEGRGNLTNATFSILDDYRVFEAGQLENIFNNKGYNQSYNQYSFNYREDYNKRLSLGVKLSLLSGITYNSIDINQSSLNIRPNEKEFDVSVNGNYKSSFAEEDLNSGIFNPTFHDPGLSVSTGASYKFKGGWFLMGNLKDIGFIKWNKNSYSYNLNNSEIQITDAASPDADERFEKEINKLLTAKKNNASYTSMTNGKVEALINQKFGNYEPNLIVSKNLFYEGGHVALANNLKVRNYVFTAIADYNLDNYIALGGQFMIKTPNVEFFVGSDQVFKTYQATRSFLSSNPQYSAGNAAGSAYFGFALKFGPVMEHQQNATFIPGMNGNFDRAGWFKKLFGKR